MDAILAKAGGFLFAKRAQSEFNSFGDDMNSLSTSVEQGARNLFNRIRGTMQVSLPELLEGYGLPKGLFPKNATNYELNEATGELTVYMPTICEVGFSDSSVVRYATTVTAIISQGSLKNIEGMKTKVLLWVNITSITADAASNKVYFNIGLKKSRPFDAYNVLRNGLETDTF